MEIQLRGFQNSTVIKYRLTGAGVNAENFKKMASGEKRNEMSAKIMKLFIIYMRG